MKKLSLIAFLLASAAGFSQENKEAKNYDSGKLQVGMRSTFSAFSDEGNPGFGVGGHFRLRFGKRLNTEWFADYITTDIEGLARRVDHHYGWAVQFYPLNCATTKGKVTPYIQAGHCFDYTMVTKNDYNNFSLGRWSSAVTSGAGMHYNITDKFDVSLSALYMMHLGAGITAKPFKGPGGEDEILVVKEDLGLEGHLLVSLSLNIYLADLWRREK